MENSAYIIQCFQTKIFNIKWRKRTCICSGLVLMMKSSAPKRCRASFSFEGEVLMTVTWCPNALPNLIATCPSPPSPTIPIRFPVDSCNLSSIIGVYTVIPAHSNGAAASIGKFSGTCATYLQHK